MEIADDRKSHAGMATEASQPNFASQAENSVWEWEIDGWTQPSSCLQCFVWFMTRSKKNSTCFGNWYKNRKNDFSDEYSSKGFLSWIKILKEEVKMVKKRQKFFENWDGTLLIAVFGFFAQSGFWCAEQKEKHFLFPIHNYDVFHWRVERRNQKCSY